MFSPPGDFGARREAASSSYDRNCGAATRSSSRRTYGVPTVHAHVYFQLVTRRYERGSILLTTNQPVTQWGQVFGDEVIAAAVLDRFLHHSHTLVVNGESYRLKQQKEAGLLSSARKA